MLLRSKRLESWRAASLALLAAALLILTACSSQNAAEPPTPAVPTPATVADVCDRALYLIGEGDTDGARALIADLRDVALERTGAALEPNADDELIARGCDPALLTALTAGATPPPALSPPEQAAKAWSALQDDWIAPLAPMVVSLLTAWAALLVLARVLVFLPGNPWFAWSQSRNREACIWGWVLILAPPLVAVSVGTVFPDHWWVVALVASVLAVFGALNLSMCLAGGMRVRAAFGNATGESDPQSLELMAHLRELGGTNPIGSEQPIGSDLKSLENAVTSLSGHTSVAAVQAAVSWLLATDPWRVNVGVNSNKDNVITSVTVLVRRNGVLVSSERVEFSDLAVDGMTLPPGAATKLAAGIIVAAMASRYVDFDGLYGAHSGLSIGLQYLATTSPDLKDTHVRLLLSKAVETEPDNILAVTSLQFQRWRESTEPEDLTAYLGFLKTALEWRQLPSLKTLRSAPGKSDESISALRRRLLLTVLSVVRNLIATFPIGNPEAESERHRLVAKYQEFALASACELIEALSAQPANEDLDAAQYRQILRMRAAVSIRRLRLVLKADDHAGLCRAMLESEDWYTDAEASPQPYVGYSVACHYVQGSLNPAGELDTLSPTATERLRTAFASQELRKWALMDPELAPIRINPDFLALVGKPAASDMWSVGPFAAQKSALHAIGIVEPWRLALHKNDDGLRVHLKLRKVEFNYLTRAATLARGAERASIRNEYAVAIVSHFLKEGIDSSGQLRRELFKHGSAVRKNLNKAFQAAHLPAPRSDDLSRWIRIMAWRG